jgi:hypothetical protein
VDVTVPLTVMLVLLALAGLAFLLRRSDLR